jgi:nicotinate-nucleotide adenylyltransferase
MHSRNVPPPENKANGALSSDIGTRQQNRLTFIAQNALLRGRDAGALARMERFDMTTRRIALFGGTFDPIHLGHTAVARAAGEQIGAERVVFVPARCSPLKGFFPIASDADRLAMIRLAIRDVNLFDANDWELRGEAPSYTLDTVRHFLGLFGPETTLHWLLGADTVSDLAHWHKIEDLIDACNLSVMYRGGYDAPTFEPYLSRWGRERVEKLRANVVQTPSIDISSTRVRKQLATGQDVQGLLHPGVIDYIRQHGLYARA